MLTQVNQAVDRGDDFAIETTLAGQSYIQMIHRWKSVGYQVELIFLQLPDVELAVERVKQRVFQGGHNIPEPDIRRRFARGRNNFHRKYCKIVDFWQIFDAGNWPPTLTDEGTNS